MVVIKPGGYLTAIVSATIGLIVGGLLGYWYCNLGGRLLGTPYTRDVDLGLILMAIVLVGVSALVGGVVATFIGLKLTNHNHALRTGLYLAGLYLGCLALSVILPPLLIIILILPFWARQLALRANPSPPTVPAAPTAITK